MRLEISGPLLATAVSVSLLAGCGGSNSDVGSAEGEDGAHEVVTTLAAALPEGDGARVCSLLAPDAQRKLEKAFEADSCPVAVDSSAGTMRQADRRALTREVDVAVQGDKASANGEAAEALARLLGQERLSLRRVEEHWVVS